MSVSELPPPPPLDSNKVATELRPPPPPPPPILTRQKNRGGSRRKNDISGRQRVNQSARQSDSNAPLVSTVTLAASSRCMVESPASPVAFVKQKSPVSHTIRRRTLDHDSPTLSVQDTIGSMGSIAWAVAHSPQRYSSSFRSTVCKSPGFDFDR